MHMPGGPLVLPPVDNMWGMQPSASPPTIEPPLVKGDVGLQATVPPKGLDGWYATIPPQAIEDGLVDNRTAYYVRCLGGPNPCPYTVPPMVLRYWMPVSQNALAAAEASTSLSATAEVGAMVLSVHTSMGFQMGRQILIDAGTPIQEVNYIAGFGSFILRFPLKYAHLNGILITMPRNVATTPMPSWTPAPFRPWSNFQPFVPFNLFAPGPGPAPFPFPGPAPGPAPGPSMYPPLLFTNGAPSPGPGGMAPGGPGGAPGGAPGPAPAR